MTNFSPIGVFDSGVGGLSVLKEMRKYLPREDFIYFADSAYCPYGGKPPEVIRQRALKIGEFLLNKGVKLLVVASNTTSASGLEELRNNLNIPIVGVEPAVKPAVAGLESGKVGVLATGVTLASARFNSLVERYCEGVEVITQPCPGLVEIVETADFSAAQPLIKGYLQPLLDQGVTTVVLGCTHYPFLREIINQYISPGMVVIDSGEAVAKQVCRVLRQEQLSNTSSDPGREEFFTSGNAETAARVMGVLWEQADLIAEMVQI